MTVICPRQRIAYQSESDALHASRRAAHRYPGAHLCPTCGFWHAGPRYQWCSTRKVPHSCEAEAQAQAGVMNAAPDGWGHNYPYECDVCGQWHIGRPHKGKTLQ